MSIYTTNHGLYRGVKSVIFYFVDKRVKPMWITFLLLKILLVSLFNNVDNSKSLSTNVDNLRNN
jgi:hypothetical protein